MTTYQHRILLIVPAGAKSVNVADWLNTNIAPGTVPPNLGPGLSSTGTLPATYTWCCGGFTDAECKTILLQLCQLSGVPKPTNAAWNSWAQTQKISWLKSVQAAILSGYGVYVGLYDNAGTWDNPDAALAVLGCKRIVEA